MIGYFKFTYLTCFYWFMVYTRNNREGEGTLVKIRGTKRYVRYVSESG